MIERVFNGIQAAANADHAEPVELKEIYYRGLLRRSRLAVSGMMVAGLGMPLFALSIYTPLQNHAWWGFATISVIACASAQLISAITVRIRRRRELGLRIKRERPAASGQPYVCVLSWVPWQLDGQDAPGEVGLSLVLPPGRLAHAFAAPAAFLAQLLFAVLVAGVAASVPLLIASAIILLSGALIVASWGFVQPGVARVLHDPGSIELQLLAWHRTFRRCDSRLMIVDAHEESRWVPVVVVAQGMPDMQFRLRRRDAKMLFKQWSAGLDARR